ncbi:hypothetical protein BHM03_00023395 [Ensete ventricosum]|nr:hypothetical protein BHM03_00023395 [Ensete ventricosum]
MPPPPFALSHISRRRKEGKGRVPTTAALVHMLVRRGEWDPLVHEPCPSMAHGGSLRARSPRGCCDPCTFSASPECVQHSAQREAFGGEERSSIEAGIYKGQNMRRCLGGGWFSAFTTGWGRPVSEERKRKGSWCGGGGAMVLSSIGSWRVLVDARSPRGCGHPCTFFGLPAGATWRTQVREESTWKTSGQ